MRNRKSLRLIQVMLESLLGRQGEDRRRNLRWVTLEKFCTILCSDKVNKESPPKGACRSHSFATVRVRRVTTPKQMSRLLLPDCSPAKASFPTLSVSMWMLDHNSSGFFWGKASSLGRLASCVMNSSEAVRTQGGT